MIMRNPGLRSAPSQGRKPALSALLFTAFLLLSGGDALAQGKNGFAYWDANGNGDLTCTEARGKDEGLKLPAYADNRNGTRVIYEWLERRRSSDTDNDGIACESTSNPNGYVPGLITPPPPTTSARECPAGSATWMGLPVCEEGARVDYDRNAFGSAYSSLEDEIIDGLPKSGGQVYTPYTCKLFDIRADGTAATDIEHIVALAEAYDSGLAESQFRTFAGDLANLTLADPAVNRTQKSDRDAGEWGPPQNSGWFAARVVAVKQKYGLSVNPVERDALQAMLNSDPSRIVMCGGGVMGTTPEVIPIEELNFAHFANGAGLTSDLVFLNLSTERSGPAPTPFHTAIPPTRPVIYFYDKEGHLIAAESVVDLTGDLAIQEDGGLTVQTEMEPLGVLTIPTHGRGTLVSGISEGGLGRSHRRGPAL